MGVQATVIIYLDAIDSIAGDANFGRKLAAAILDKANHDNLSDRTVSFNAASRHGSETAGRVIAAHHADQDVTIVAGGNTARIVRDQKTKKSNKPK